MGVGQIFILDPKGKSDVSVVTKNPRPKQIEGLTIGVIDNTKPNFDLFMDTVQEKLLSEFKVREVIRYRKPGRTKGASQEILDDIKKRCDFVITGLGDWGSCTSWSLHDCVEVEKIGVPALIVTTTSYNALADMEAKAKGLEHVSILKVPHPLGAGVRPEVVKTKALNSMENLEKLITGKME